MLQRLNSAMRLIQRYSHELALVHERERPRGNKNRATLAVAGRWLPTWSQWAQKTGLRAYRRIQRHCRCVKSSRNEKHQDYSVRRLPGPAGDGLSDGGNSRGSHRFVSGLAESANSGCPVLRRAGTKSREATLRNGRF